MDPAPLVAEDGSAFGRMFNVLPAPGETFQQIKERPVNHWNWILPAIVWFVIASSVVIMIFSMDSFKYEMKKQQEKAFQQQVDKGKMTQAQADQIMNNMPPWAMEVAKVFAVIATGVYAVAVPFFWGFFVWILCVKVYNADIEFMKAVEAVGLASIIYTLAAVIGGLLSITMGKMTHFSPGFFVHDFDMSNRSHMALAALNPFYLWYVIVLAVSISVLASVSLKRTLPWCLGIWIALRVLALSTPYTMNFVL